MVLFESYCGVQKCSVVVGDFETKSIDDNSIPTHVSSYSKVLRANVCYGPKLDYKSERTIHRKIVRMYYFLVSSETSARVCSGSQSPTN